MQLPRELSSILEDLCAKELAKRKPNVIHEEGKAHEEEGDVIMTKKIAKKPAKRRKVNEEQKAIVDNADVKMSHEGVNDDSKNENSSSDSSPFNSGFKNPDYIQSKQLSKVMDCLGSDWHIIADLEICVLNQLNQDFESGEDPLLFHKTDTYMNLVCKYMGCPFQYWFVQDDEQCRKHRSVNMNHSRKAHEGKVLKKKFADSGG